MKDLMDIARDYLHKLAALGYDAYIVGGAVRDILRGVEVSDVDIATNCPIKVLDSNFTTFDIGKSRDFGILLVRYEGEHFETAQFRSDGRYEDGRRPDKVEIVGDIFQDLTRRDFTVNAMAMDMAGRVIDPVGGQCDIQAKLIRAVGNPMVRFGEEDHLRMVRAARFGAMEGFTIEEKTRLAIRRLSFLVHKVSKERMYLELVKAASKSGMEFSRFISLLDRLKLLSKILPEVHAMKYFDHDMRWHPEGPTVMAHTLKALEVSGDSPWLSKMAILFHDIGKCICFDEVKHGYKFSYPRHEHGSAMLARQICERLKFSIDGTEGIVFAAENHMKFHSILKMRPAKIARLVSNPYFDTLADVCYADEFARGEKYQRHDQFQAALDRAHEIRDKWETRIIDSKIKLVDGNRIMEVLDIKPGPLVGEIKSEVEDSILNEEIDPDDTKTVHQLILRAFLIKGD